MQVFIYDVDFMANESPNFLAMRISSFHKQQGDSVTLLRPKDKMPKKPQLLYVLQHDPSLPHPSVQILMAPYTKVYGVRHFSNWQPIPALLACRPDYLLYPRGRDKFERSDAVQLTDERGHLLTLRQDDRNLETNKDTIVTDEHLWDLNNSELLQALEGLKYRKNIYFLYPITLSRLLDDSFIKDAFLNLKLARTVELKWNNSLPFIREKVGQVIDFFDEYKAWHPRNLIGQLSFYPKPTTTLDKDNIHLAIRLICWMKLRQWKIEIEKLHTRLDSAYSHYYELLHNWSLQPHLSFFELIAQTPAKQAHMTIEEYYCHPERWTDEMFRAGIELYHTVNQYQWITNKQWACWQYDTLYYNPANINWAALLRKELWY